MVRAKFISAALFVAAFTFSAFAADGTQETWIEGTHYTRLPVPVKTLDKNTVEVVEMFSYACVHCFNFDDMLHDWVSNSDPDMVSFRRTPAVFSQIWALYAQAFYTAEVLGVTDKIHLPLFKAIHQDRQDFRDPKQMAALFETHADVKPADFEALYNSFSVRSRVEQAIATGRAVKLSGVPSLVVNGKYLVDGPMAGDNTNMLKVVDYLIAQERADLN